MCIYFFIFYNVLYSNPSTSFINFQLQKQTKTPFNVADYIFNEFKTYKNLKIHHPQNLKSLSSSSFIHRKQHRKAKHKNNKQNRSIVKNYNN